MMISEVKIQMMINIVLQYWRDSTLSHKLVTSGLFVFFAFLTIDWGIARSGLYFFTLVATISLIYGCKPSGLKRSGWFVVIMGLLAVFVAVVVFEEELIKYSVLIILLSSIFLLATCLNQPFKLDGWERIMFGVLLLLLIHSLISWWVNDFPDPGYVHIRSRQGKLMALIPLLLFVRKQGFPKWLFFGLIAIGAAVAGIDGLIEFIKNDFSFVKRLHGGGDESLHYAVIMGAFTVVLWGGVGAFFNKHKILFAGLTIALFFALFGTVVAASRGVWLGVIIAFFVMLVANWKQLELKGIIVLVGACIVLIALLMQVSNYRFRVGLIPENIETYLNGEAKHTSESDRFELWRIAWVLGAENPIFGVGPAGFDSTVKDEHVQRNWNSRYLEYEYPHNQFMGAFASRGIPGFVLDLLILLVPAWLFLKDWKRLDSQSRSVALSGLLVVVVYLVSCLTYDHMIGRVQVSQYAVLLGLLLGMLSSSNNTSQERKA